MKEFRSRPILLKKSFCGRCLFWKQAYSNRISAGVWHKFRELSEILSGCCHEELGSGALWSSEAKAIELQNAFQARE